MQYRINCEEGFRSRKESEGAGRHAPVLQAAEIEALVEVKQDDVKADGDSTHVTRDSVSIVCYGTLTNNAS
jgi:hypothetical protein